MCNVRYPAVSHDKVGIQIIVLPLLKISDEIVTCSYSCHVCHVDHLSEIFLEYKRFLRIAVAVAEAVARGSHRLCLLNSTAPMLYAAPKNATICGKVDHQVKYARQDEKDVSKYRGCSSLQLEDRCDSCPKMRPHLLLLRQR